MEVEIRYESSKLKNVTAPPTPPPLPPKPKFQAAARIMNKSSSVISLTNEEIAKYWRQKRLDEEDHLLAAIKAAARIHAQNLTENNYQQFEESLKEDDDDDDDSKENSKSVKSSNKKDDSKCVIRVGIKDWWTNSKYAYLNQPVTQSMDAPRRRASSYTPQFYCLMSVPPLATTTFGIF